MGPIYAETEQKINKILSSMNAQSLISDPSSNMTDILFAIECYMENFTETDLVSWHVDRSRNDI